MKSYVNARVCTVLFSLTGHRSIGWLCWEKWASWGWRLSFLPWNLLWPCAMHNYCNKVSDDWSPQVCVKWSWRNAWRPALQHTLLLRYGSTLKGCYSLVRLVCFSLLHAMWSFSWWLQCKEAFIKVMNILVNYLEADNIGSCIRALHFGPRTLHFCVLVHAWPQCNVLGQI